MANGIMQLRQSDSDELRITKINQNFLALLNSLGKGFSGFSLDNNNTGYYNSLINRLEYDNVYADRFGAYIASADYLNVGTAWFNSATFQQAIADSLDVNSLIARTITVDTVTAGEVEVDLLHAMYLRSTVADFSEAQANVLNASLVNAGNGLFQYFKSGSAYITTLNADYIKAGTLEFDRLISTDKATGKKYFARIQEIEGTPQLVWDIQVDETLVEDNSIGINQIVNILQGENGMINLGQGTFSFYKDDKTVLNWDGEKLLIALNSALIKFVDREDADADKIASLVDQYTTLSGLDDRVTDVTNGLADSNDRIDVIENWLSIEDARLVIGRVDQTGVATLTLTADAVTLSYDNSTATLTSKGLESNQALFKNSAKIGGFVWESRKGVIEHLSLKYIGEM